MKTTNRTRNQSTNSALAFRIFVSVLLATLLGIANAQTRVQTKQPKPSRSAGANSGGTFTPQEAAVHGSGTAGRVSKWLDSNSIGDSIVSESTGKIGIGTSSPTSTLTVVGMIETTLGGYKFPDGTIQTTAAANGIQQVFHDSTLIGNGTSGSPLGIAAPLLLRGASSPQPMLTVQNDGFGFAIQGNGLDQNGLAGYSNTADGTSGQTNGANHSGILGINTNSGGYGVTGRNPGNGNFGYLGGPSNGAYGFSSSGNGVTSESSTGLAGNFLGNVSITGTLGIEASPSGSKLAVAGLIQSTTGGFKFPDGTIQTTAATNASGNFIQNTTTQQPNSNFNISGSGTAGGELRATVVTADAFFKIANHKMLSLANDADPDTSTNIAVGIGAGASNGFFQTTPRGNTYVGRDAGRNNVAQSGNTFIGYQAGINNGESANINFVDANANTFVGYQAGLNNRSTGSNADNRTSGQNTFIGHSAGNSNVFGYNNTALGHQADVGSDSLSFATAIGSGAVVSSSNTIALGRSDGSDTVDVPGKLQIDTLATAGSTQLCLNGANRVGPCSSSLRYKTGVQAFFGGLNIIRRLRPISFTWKDSAKRDLGLGAEDVERVEPLLTFRNNQGEIEGVKYNQLSAVFVNAFKEQQAQIQRQQEQIRKQQDQLANVLARLKQLERRRVARR